MFEFDPNFSGSIEYHSGDSSIHFLLVRIRLKANSKHNKRLLAELWEEFFLASCDGLIILIIRR